MADAIIEGIKARFDDFLERYYRPQIDDLIIAFPDKRSLKVDFADLSKFDPELAQEMIDKPDLILDAANESLRGKFGDVEVKSRELHVRVFGQNVNSPLVMDIGSDFIGKMVRLDSLIVKRSEINPKAKIDAYKCSYCGSVYKFRAGKEANHSESMKLLSEAGLRPLSYQELLPLLMKDEQLRNTLKGKWFWIAGQGMYKRGMFTINKKGELREIAREEKPSAERKVYVWSGDQPLSFVVYSDAVAAYDGRRFNLSAGYEPLLVAPVVVGVPVAQGPQ